MDAPAAASASHGIIAGADDVTPVVLRAMHATPHPRLREVMAALVRHLHAFAREVRLTEDQPPDALEPKACLDCGQVCTTRRWP